MSQNLVKVAVVQRPPVLLDRDATMKVAIDAVAEVAAEGAVLAVFPEAFIPGYPRGSGSCARATTTPCPLRSIRSCSLAAWT